ncbi:hypothetical protein DFH06DRAFT_1302358 [Mycena polygramma]|nr:hypothetical protein DFH06DRAFT_1302358 [Mycena polygramma]
MNREDGDRTGNNAFNRAGLATVVQLATVYRLLAGVRIVGEGEQTAKERERHRWTGTDGREREGRAKRGAGENEREKRRKMAARKDGIDDEKTRRDGERRKGNAMNEREWKSGCAEDSPPRILPHQARVIARVWHERVLWTQSINPPHKVMGLPYSSWNGKITKDGERNAHVVYNRSIGFVCVQEMVGWSTVGEGTEMGRRHEKGAIYACTRVSRGRLRAGRVHSNAERVIDS